MPNNAFEDKLSEENKVIFKNLKQERDGWLKERHVPKIANAIH